MPKGVVLYARVSGDDRHQEDRNLLGQLEMCRTYAQEHGYQIVAELREDDRGASGAAFELPQLNLVREMAQRGEYSILITRELDRLSRNLAKQLLVEEELKRHGVQIEYVLGTYADTPEGNLMKNIRASVAEYERLKISERMVRGRELKVKAGSVLVYKRPPFGYAVTEVDHKWRLVINEEEAYVVRLIFEWYTVGDSNRQPLTIQAIQEKLNMLGVPTYADRRKNGQGKKRAYGEWGQAQIGRILKCETYAGVWHWRKNARTKAGRQVPRPRAEHLPVSVPALISREMWELAQRRRTENATSATRNLKHQYLLRRRLSCGQCGATLAAFGVTNAEGRHYSYYRCAAALDKKHTHYIHSCDAPNFKVDEVDRQIWRWVRSLLMDSVVLQQGLDALEAERQTDRGPTLTHLQDIEVLLTEQRRQLARLLEAYLTGLFPKELVEERRAKLDRRIGELEAERTTLNTQLTAPALTSEQVRNLADFAAEIGSRLTQSHENYDLQRHIIETLDVKARLTVEPDAKVIYVQCALGQDGLAAESQTILDRPLSRAGRGRRALH